jgi:hypothetical protein
MKCATLALTAILLATCGTAFADGGGTFIVKGKTYLLKSAYAYSRPDPFSPSKQSTVILFSEILIDTKKVDSATDRGSALSHIMSDHLPDKDERAGSVEIMIARDDAQFPLQQIGYTIPNEDSSASVGADRYKLVLKRNDAKRIEGTLVSTKEAAKTAEHGGYFDLHFALDVASAQAAK